MGGRYRQDQYGNWHDVYTMQRDVHEESALAQESDDDSVEIVEEHVNNEQTCQDLEPKLPAWAPRRERPTCYPPRTADLARWCERAARRYAEGTSTRPCSEVEGPFGV